MVRTDLRNIAIIAHVDHGKTTLVDEMLKQCGEYHENQQVTERVMDSGDLERERGITILAKNTSVIRGDVRINIVDTPGHADFGGEVERILKMVNGVLLLVDAAEGPMPQTRFVLGKAMELGHKIIVVINKIDRPDARLEEVEEEVLELLLELDATDEQLDSPMIFCSGRAGTASLSPYEKGVNLDPLFNTIIDYIPAPEGDSDAPLQLLVSSIDYNDYVGRIGIGRIERGTAKIGDEAVVVNYHDPDATPKKMKLVSMFEFDGLDRVPAQSATVGDIVCFSGAEDITIGDTIASPLDPTPLEFVKVSEPTMEMTFSVNDSPFAGREGKFVTSRQLRERLYKETLRDVSLRVADGETDRLLQGRGTRRNAPLDPHRDRCAARDTSSPARHPTSSTRRSTERSASRWRESTLTFPKARSGAVIEKLGSRKGELVQMTPSGSRMKIEYLIPARGLLGYRSEFLTDTRGEGIINSLFDGYQPYKGEITMRYTGSLTASEAGEATSYGLYNAQDRGALFIGVQTPVYEGMIVGQCPKMEDIAVNVCKKKHLTAIRSTGADEALRLTPPIIFSLEEAIEFIAEDELIEVTPKSIRLRKRTLSTEQRLKDQAKKKKGL